MSDQSPHRGLTRRGFLETTSLTGAAAVLGPSVLGAGMAQAAQNGEVLTGSHWGAFHATVTDGRWTAVRGWEEDRFPTKMLEGVMDSVYSPTRIKYPMVRRAYLEGGPGTASDTRGRDDFVRVSWDQALQLVADEVARVQEESGPKGIFGGSYGWKSPGKFNNARNLLRRFLNGTGGFVSHVGDYSTGASQVIMRHVLGTIEVYEQQTAWPVVVENTDLMVLWGANPVVTNKIGWVVPDHGAYEGMEDFKAAGKRVICIDPIRSDTAAYMNAEWIAPKPQTDVTMMMGIAHTLLEEGLHDQAFMDTYTTGFDQFLPYLTGESDGQPKDADWAAGVCGVEADVIRQLARDFAANRTMLASGWSTQRMHHGEQAHWMLVTLAAMLGQIGLPGGGFGLSYHYSSGGSPSAKGPRPSGMNAGSVQLMRTDAQPDASDRIPVARITDMLENPGGAFDFNGEAGIYPDINLVYWVGGNPFAHHQDQNRLLRALQKVDTFIVQDFQWTPTARHADIVLPATSAFERNDIEMYGDYSQKGVLAMKKVIEPMYEARSDFDIFADLSDRFGTRAYFDEGKDEMTWIRQFYETTFDQQEATGITMPDFDTFWDQGYVMYPVTDEGRSFVRYAAFRDDPVLEPLGTPSGLIEIYSRNIEKMGYDDCPPHPTWMEPIERLDGPDAKYPLHVSSQHSIGRLHSQLCGTSFRETYAVAGREPCLINTADAAARGIADGDVVRVYNDRGALLAGAVVTDDIRRGVLKVSEGGWYSPAEPGTPGTVCAYGNVNILTPDLGTSKLAQGNCGHTANAEVEKFVGTPPAVTVFDTPRNG
ncbi:trimethylamine-N-oxide reductase TorA [Yoonia sp. R2-816]|uniref:trimethylamine-N-oxide reductase TorA n=1 Tax=Yoonia sp. R2-816 TaxID=3342638 RepID=UPI003727C8C3